MGTKAISLMCGNEGDNGCSWKKLYRAFGNVNSAFVPFQINYITETTDDYVAINPKVLRCNESVDATKPSCSCMDCSLVYETLIQPAVLADVDEDFVFGLHKYTFLSALLFLIGSAFFLIIVSYDSSDNSGE